MKIGTLASMANCSTETVRFYEKEGLLPEPDRTASNYRTYSGHHLERLRFIRNCRTLDMTHDEIRSLLRLMDHPQGDCEPVNSLLDEHIVHVDVRLQELGRMRTQLLDLREKCASASAVGDCGIIQGLASMETEEKHRSGSHLG
jgi:Cd(II)/Pb(II)-responsive transcriptional regulator